MNPNESRPKRARRFEIPDSLTRRQEPELDEEETVIQPPLPPRVVGKVFDCLVCRSPVVKKNEEDVLQVGDDGSDDAVWWYFVCTNERCGKVYPEIPEQAVRRRL